MVFNEPVIIILYNIGNRFIIQRCWYLILCLCFHAKGVKIRNPLFRDLWVNFVNFHACRVLLNFPAIILEFFWQNLDVVCVPIQSQIVRVVLIQRCTFSRFACQFSCCCEILMWVTKSCSISPNIRYSAAKISFIDQCIVIISIQ